MKPYKRSVRVGHEIMRIVAETIRTEARDPRIRNVTILRVEVTDDLRIAKIFYSSVDGEEAERGLESARGFLRGKIAKNLRIKFIPEITFVRVEEENGWFSQHQ
ncbi:MAG: 30S ribosome-binding factor RbfA [Candidatus Hydrothermota bacterium]|nr:MAG: 30S ribosome-binding factor RbfA [Candidatus Hydrothermae bacterium]